MPFVASCTGYISHEKPSRVQRARKQQRMNLYRFVSPGYFYLYRVYPEDKARTDQAKNAIAMFYQEERQRRYEFWVKYDKPRETARAFALRSADQDWRRRIRAHAKEILRARHLPLSTPIIALALPRKAKRPGI